MSRVQEVELFDDISNKIVMTFNRCEGIEFDSLSAVEKVLKAVRIPGANWAKVISYEGGEFGDQGYAERLYRLIDEKWSDCSRFISEVGLADTRRSWRYEKRYHQRTEDSQEFPKYLDFWREREKIRKILLRCDPYEICSFPLFQEAVLYSPYAKESYAIAQYEEDTEDDISSEHVQMIFSEAGIRLDNESLMEVCRQLKGNSHLCRCPICRSFTFSESKNQEKCIVCGEIKNYDQDAEAFLYSAPEGYLTERDRELIFFIKRHEEDHEEIDKILSDFDFLNNEGTEKDQGRYIRPQKKPWEKEPMTAVDQQIVQLFIHDFMKYTNETQEWLSDLVYRSGSERVILALLDYDGRPMEFQLDPADLTIEELSEFPQNNITDYMVMALMRQDIKTIRDLQKIPEEKMLSVPGIGKRGFCSLCYMIQLFGNQTYGKDMVKKIEHTLPKFRETISSHKLNLQKLRMIEDEGRTLPETNWAWLENNPSKSLFDYYEKRYDPEGYLSYIASLFDIGYSVEVFRYYDNGGGYSSPEENFCMKRSHRINFDDSDDMWGIW